MWICDSCCSISSLKSDGEMFLHWLFISHQKTSKWWKCVPSPCYSSLFLITSSRSVILLVHRQITKRWRKVFCWLFISHQKTAKWCFSHSLFLTKRQSRFVILLVHRQITKWWRKILVRRFWLGGGTRTSPLLVETWTPGLFLLLCMLRVFCPLTWLKLSKTWFTNYSWFCINIVDWVWYVHNAKMILIIAVLVFILYHLNLCFPDSDYFWWVFVGNLELPNNCDVYKNHVI